MLTRKTVRLNDIYGILSFTNSLPLHLKQDERWEGSMGEKKKQCHFLAILTNPYIISLWEFNLKVRQDKESIHKQCGIFEVCSQECNTLRSRRDSLGDGPQGSVGQEGKKWISFWGVRVAASLMLVQDLKRAPRWLLDTTATPWPLGRHHWALQHHWAAKERGETHKARLGVSTCCEPAHGGGCRSDYCQPAWGWILAVLIHFWKFPLGQILSSSLSRISSPLQCA